MRFDKEAYKKAMNKIKEPERLENQRYKANVLNGKHPDTHAGSEYNDGFFDREMILKENKESMLSMIPVIIIGLFFAAIAIGFTYNYFYMRANGIHMVSKFTLNIWIIVGFDIVALMWNAFFLRQLIILIREYISLRRKTKEAKN